MFCYNTHGSGEPPRASEPVSPIKILAGGALNHKKPIEAPIIAPQKTATSPTPSGINKYSEKITLPET